MSANQGVLYYKALYSMVYVWKFLIKKDHTLNFFNNCKGKYKKKEFID